MFHLKLLGGGNYCESSNSVVLSLQINSTVSKGLRNLIAPCVHSCCATHF